MYNIFGCTFFRYVPPLLWGKNGHLQTVVYAKMGRMRDPVPSGTRHTKTLQDGSTLTFDLYQPTAQSSCRMVIVEKLKGAQQSALPRSACNGVTVTVTGFFFSAGPS